MVVIGKLEKKYVYWINFESKIILQKKKETWNWNQWVFLWEILLIWKKNSKRKIFIKIFSLFMKILLNCETSFLPHLDLAFSLVVLLKLFRYVVKTCCYLMFNPFWDAIEWHNIWNLKKKSLIETFFLTKLKSDDILNQFYDDVA
jgi:hypothetical protein